MRVTQAMIDAGFGALHSKTRDDLWLNSHAIKWRQDLCVAIYAAMAALQPPVETKQPKHLPHDVRGHTEEKAPEPPEPKSQAENRTEATIQRGARKKV